MVLQHSLDACNMLSGRGVYTAASKQKVLRRGATGRRRVSYLGKTKVLCITNICGTAMYVVLLGILRGDSGCVWLEA